MHFTVTIIFNLQYAMPYHGYHTMIIPINHIIAITLL